MVFFKGALSNPCKKRDRKATELALLHAASKLFAEKGYENTRTLDIAKEAGANEALIGRYFGGKEGLLLAVMKDEKALELATAPGAGCKRLDQFPDASEVKDLKAAIKLFFVHGLQHFDLAQEFVKIGLSRALLDPEMAEVVRKKMIDHNLPLMLKGMRTHAGLSEIKKSDLEAMALLLMSVNFNLNFMGRRIYGMSDAQVDRSLEILTQSLVSFAET